MMIVGLEKTRSAPLGHLEHRQRRAVFDLIPDVERMEDSKNDKDKSFRRIKVINILKNPFRKEVSELVQRDKELVTFK